MIGAMLLAAVWNARALVCLASDRAHVTAVAAGWRDTDPWGRPLVLKVTAGLVPDATVLSVGPDGVDQRGGGDDIEPWPRLSWQFIGLSIAPSIGLGALVAALLTVVVGRIALPARSPWLEGLIVLASAAPLGLYVLWASWVGEDWLIEASTALGVRTGRFGVMVSGIAGAVVVAAVLRRLRTTRASD